MQVTSYMIPLFGRCSKSWFVGAELCYNIVTKGGSTSLRPIEIAFCQTMPPFHEPSCHSLVQDPTQLIEVKFRLPPDQTLARSPTNTRTISSAFVVVKEAKLALTERKLLLL